MRLKWSATLCLILLLASCDKNVEKITAPKLFSNTEIDRKVDSIIASMTLDEKLAQIEGIRPALVMEDGQFSPEKAKAVMSNGMGHFCQFASSLTKSPEELRDFVREVQHWLMNETRTGIPAIFHEEAITGFATKGATTYPQQIGMGCTWNPELIAQVANTTRKNMRDAGATFALSPMLDISRTAYWERIEESYGEDAYLTSRLGVAFVNGLQGDDLRTGVAATTKHFAGYGSQNNDKKELYEEYIMPHEAAIKVAGSKSVMPSYGKYNGIPVAASKEMLTDILRTHLKYDGLVVSDYGAISLLHNGHKYVDSHKDAGVQALNAGIDIELSKPIAFPFLPEAINEGLIDEAIINTALKRSLIMKSRLGLLDEKPVIGKDGVLDFDPPHNRKLAYQAACESTVLLKNNGILPLNENVKKVALLGPNSSTVYCLLGDYTYQSMISFWWSTPFDSNDPKLVSLHEGLAFRFGDDIDILQERGCDWSTPLETQVITDGLGDDRLGKLKLMTIEGQSQPDLQKALNYANESDVIIAAVGENIYLCGEGRARKGIKLPGEQEAFVQKLVDTGKPVILVVFGGRQQLLSKFSDKCAAIVQTWFPGEEGGNAIADILTGRVNPSGKLCISYPATDSKTETNYKNGFDVSKIQYPFGFGLSYTTFEYSNIEMPSEVKNNSERFSISINVKNSGDADGTEIVQLYVSPSHNVTGLKPIQLKGFKRVALQKGEEKTVTFNVSPQQLAQFENGTWSVKSGDYKLMAGASSVDIKLSKIIKFSGEDQILEDGRSVFFTLTD